MGVEILKMNSYFEFNQIEKIDEIPRQVLALAIKVVEPIIADGLPDNLKHLVVATTCPDMVSPSLGQLIIEQLHEHFSELQTIDMVQGCAGGVASMILASQLCALNHSSAIVINADAAFKATSKQHKISSIFGNGAFSCLMHYTEIHKSLIYSKSKQYKGLSEVVTVKLGHDADQIIMDNLSDMASDPRLHLGLSMNNDLAIKLLKHAENFYLEFVAASTKPDIMILHQVNPIIIKHLKSVFEKYDLEFIDVSNRIGNCGAATVGIALDLIKDKIEGKKVLLCSFGTGGVISAGMWQN